MNLSQREEEARALVDAWSDRILRLAWTWLPNPADAPDVVQNVLLKRLAHTGGFPAPEAERAWMIRVTINECKNFRRSLFRRREVSLEEAAPQPSPPGEESELLEELRRLPPKDKEILVLYYYEGYSTTELAQLWNMRPDAVRMRLSRARARLKERLEGTTYESHS